MVLLLMLSHNFLALVGWIFGFFRFLFLFFGGSVCECLCVGVFLGGAFI